MEYCPSLLSQLAAMQYQTYFLDRTQQQSTTAHHKVSEFLPFEYTTVRNIEEKVLKEQMMIRSYSRQQAQDSYVHDACTLATYRVVFFPVKVRRKEARDEDREGRGEARGWGQKVVRKWVGRGGGEARGIYHQLTVSCCRSLASGSSRTQS